ncbi:YhdP family protein [Roseovarius salis]|uniref:YhdP family protein n=1 Tax=Roseovarius salis TaxID=3376063 RepID=UPI0037CA7B20
MSKRTDTDTGRRARGGRLRATALWVTALGLAVGVVLVVAASALIGTRLSAPEWLRDRITAQINSSFEGITVSFRDVSFVMQEGWVPHVSLRSVRLSDAVGRPLAQLSDLQGKVALRPLLRGELRPAEIRLSGARVTLRRSADGAVGLSLGDRPEAVEEAETVAALIRGADDVFQSPRFSALREVSADNLTLRFEDARVGKAWTADGGRISISRDGRDIRIRTDFALVGARDYATTMAMTYSGRIGEPAAAFTVDFDDMPARDIAGQSPALSWLTALEAPISGSVAAEVDRAGQLGPLEASLEIGKGVLHPTEAVRPVAFDKASSQFTYTPGDRILRFRQLEIDSSWGRARIEGQTQLAGMEDGWPDTLVSQFRVLSLDANPMELYAEPVTFEGATMDMRLALDPFQVTLGEFSLSDRGRNLVLRGEARAQRDGWYVSVDGRMPGIAPERVLTLWPENLEPKTRSWIDENIHEATLENIQLALRAEPGRKPDVFLGLDFKDLTARFIKDVPPIEGARGHARISDNQFVVIAHEGHVDAARGGRIDVAGSSFEIPDIRVKRGPGRVRLSTRGTITAALSMLDEEPFRFLQKAGRPVTLADGTARLAGTLDFLVKDDLTPEEVAFDIKGTLQDVRSDELIEDKVISAPELTLAADRTSLAVRGTGRVGAVPVGGTWRMPLASGSKGRARVEGWIELSERFAQEFGIGLPPGSIDGAGRGEVEIAFTPDAPPTFELASDLDGLALRLDPLGWRLDRNQTGRLEVSGTMGAPPRIDDLSLDAGGLRADGTVTLNDDGSLRQAAFRRVQLGSWIDAPVDLVGRGNDVPPLVRVTGGQIDLRQTSLVGGGDGASRGDGGPVSLRLDRLQISDTIALTEFSADLDMAGGADGTFTGRVNGGYEIAGRVVPRDGRSAFRITADNAGGVLRSARLMEQARDGSMVLILVPAEGQGVYEGRLNIDNLRVKDAPAIAALLNALSIVGILEQLAGEGIHFNRVETEFQLAPDRVTLYSGSAVGASMGISMAGYYWLEQGVMDMDGVISPVYAVNMLGGVFAREGEGFLGFQYSLDGPARAPRVQVNPLSVFTPGMFREIFRRPPPQRGFATGGVEPASPDDTGEEGGLDPADR